jgi:hypothetical protein
MRCSGFSLRGPIGSDIFNSQLQEPLPPTSRSENAIMGVQLIEAARKYCVEETVVLSTIWLRRSPASQDLPARSAGTHANQTGSHAAVWTSDAPIANLASWLRRRWSRDWQKRSAGIRALRLHESLCEDQALLADFIPSSRELREHRKSRAHWFPCITPFIDNSGRPAGGEL